MRIYVVRHAWAVERDGQTYPTDEARPLTAEGAERFREFAKKLSRRGVQVVAVAHSPLLRCVQTAEILAAACASGPICQVLPALAPQSDAEAAVLWSRQQAAGDLAWVGHVPDVGDLTAALIGQGRFQVDFAKGAIAAIEFHQRPALGEGALRWMATAKLLGC